MMLKHLARACALLLALTMPLQAVAQTATTTLPRGIYEPSGRQQVQTQPVALVTKDSVSGDWCIVGSSVTCLLPGAGGGGGGGGAVTIADGAAVPIGARADAAWSGSGNGTLVAIEKAIRNILVDIRDSTTAVPITDNGGSLTVDGAVAATQSGAWTVQPGNTANTTPWLVSGPTATAGAVSGNPFPMGCDHVAAAPTYTAGWRTTCQSDLRGNLKVTLFGNDTINPVAMIPTNTDALTVSSTQNRLGVAALGQMVGATNIERAKSIAGTFGSAVGVAAVENAGTPSTRINSNTTLNAIKTGAGIFHKICVGVAGASANTITLYDSLTATGTVLAVIDTTTSRCLSYDIAFATGLTAVQAAGTASDSVLGWR